MSKKIAACLGGICLLFASCASLRRPVLSFAGKDSSVLYYTEPFSYKKGNLKELSIDFTATCKENEVVQASVKYTVCLEGFLRKDLLNTKTSLVISDKHFLLDPKTELYSEPAGKLVRTRFESFLQKEEAMELLNLCATDEELFICIADSEGKTLATIPAGQFKERLYQIFLMVD